MVPRDLCDRIVEHWYGRVTPVENPAVSARHETGVALEFDDYGIRDGPWTADGTTYEWTFRHDARDLAWEGTTRAAGGARQRLAIESARREASSPGDARHADGSLATLEIAVSRHDGRRGRPATVYLRWEADSNVYRVVGLEH